LIEKENNKGKRSLLQQFHLQKKYFLLQRASAQFTE